MKKKQTLFFLAIMPIWLNAQCYDCYSKKPEIAIGVTLLSNMKFTAQGQITQPLELNLRYKITENSTLRIGTPIVWKQNISGEPVAYSFTPSLEEYVENMHKEELYPRYNSFYRILDNHYSLYGFSLGYDYSVSVANNLSAFVGCDLGYYHQKITSEYYFIYNSIIGDNQQLAFLSITKREQKIVNNILSAKPQLGLRYSFQKITLEAALAYHIAYNFIDIKGLSRIWYEDSRQYDELYVNYSNQYNFTSTGTPNRFVYDIRLFYNF